MIDTGDLLTRLTARRGTPSPEGRANLLAERLLALAPAMELTGMEALVDILDLWLSLAEKGPASYYAQGLMRVVLSARTWPVAKRTAFLRRHLVGRDFSHEDNTLACVLFGLGEEAAK